MLVLVLAGALAGLLLGRSIGGTDRSEPDRASAKRSVAAGQLRLSLPAGWSRSSDPPPIPGFDSAQRIAAQQPALRVDVVAALLPADDVTLLPSQLLRRLTTRPGPPTSALEIGGGLRAREYLQLRLKGTGQVLDVLVAPTTAGVASVACIARPAAAPVLSSCAEAARSVTVTGTRPVPLGPSAAFRSRLPAVLAALDAARMDENAAAARADRGAVRRLAAAHLRAGRALSPLADRSVSAQQRIASALIEQAKAYELLAESLAAQRRGPAVRARARVRTAESELRRALRCAASALRSCA